MQIKFTHIALQCRNIQKTMDFYKKYCGMKIVPRNSSKSNQAAYWLVDSTRQKSLVLVLFEGHIFYKQNEKDYTHLGFSMSTKHAVLNLSKQAEEEGLLAWPPTQEEEPLGFFCGIKDPDGRVVEFSYGQTIDF